MTTTSKIVLIPFDHDGDFEFSTPFMHEPIVLPDDIRLETLTLDKVKALVGQTQEYADHCDEDDGGFMLRVAGAFAVTEEILKTAHRLAQYAMDGTMHTDDNRDTECVIAYGFVGLTAMHMVGEHIALKPPRLGHAFKDAAALDTVAGILRAFGTHVLPRRDEADKAPFFQGALRTLADISQVVGETDRVVDHE